MWESVICGSIDTNRKFENSKQPSRNVHIFYHNFFLFFYFPINYFLSYLVAHYYLNEGNRFSSQPCGFHCKPVVHILYLDQTICTQSKRCHSFSWIIFSFGLIKCSL